MLQNHFRTAMYVIDANDGTPVATVHFASFSTAGLPCPSNIHLLALCNCKRPKALWKRAFTVPHAKAIMERGVSIHICDPWLCAMQKQHPHVPGVPTPAGEVERGPSTLIPACDLRTAPDE
eukprot:scaffold205580_cov36-Prasinocladus_malaysianus.AAC.1